MTGGAGGAGGAGCAVSADEEGGLAAIPKENATTARNVPSIPNAIGTNSPARGAGSLGGTAGPALGAGSLGGTAGPALDAGALSELADPSPDPAPVDGAAPSGAAALDGATASSFAAPNEGNHAVATASISSSMASQSAGRALVCFAATRSTNAMTNSGREVDFNPSRLGSLVLSRPWMNASSTSMRALPDSR
jgi:hypothetical protein